MINQQLLTTFYCSLFCFSLFTLHFSLFHVGRQTTIHLAGRGTGAGNVRRFLRCSRRKQCLRSALLLLHGKPGAGNCGAALLCLLAQEAMRSNQQSADSKTAAWLDQASQLKAADCCLLFATCCLLALQFGCCAVFALTAIPSSPRTSRLRGSPNGVLDGM